VSAWFAGNGGAVVTNGAAFRRRAVVEIHRSPQGINVTVVTGVAARDVGDRFACHRSAVVTSAASFRRCAVIESN
jgi:hypothetical protein